MKIGQNGESELILEAFFEIPIYGIFLCISRYFAKCTPTLDGHRNRTVGSWEVVEHILDAGYPGLQHLRKKTKKKIDLRPHPYPLNMKSIICQYIALQQPFPVVIH